jgi:hypothetical protein
MHPIALGVEEAACRILERLAQKIGDAEIDYETFAGLHNFIIKVAGIRFRVQFAEEALLRRSIEELEETIHKVAERVLCKSALRQASA